MAWTDIFTRKWSGSLGVLSWSISTVFAVVNLVGQNRRVTTPGYKDTDEDSPSIHTVHIIMIVYIVVYAVSFVLMPFFAWAHLHPTHKCCKGVICLYTFAKMVWDGLLTLGLPACIYYLGTIKFTDLWLAIGSLAFVCYLFFEAFLSQGVFDFTLGTAAIGYSLTIAASLPSRLEQWIFIGINCGVGGVLLLLKQYYKHVYLEEMKATANAEGGGQAAAAAAAARGQASNVAPQTA